MFLLLTWRGAQMKPPKGGPGLEKVMVSYVGGTEDDDEWIPVGKVRHMLGLGFRV